MSLDWNISQVRNYEELIVDDSKEWAITQNLIWSTIAIDMGAITDDNWQEFYARLTTYERLIGTPSADLTPPKEVKRRIGLYCNVTTRTRLQWLKRVVNNRMDDFVSYADWKIEKEAEA